MTRNQKVSIDMLKFWADLAPSFGMIGTMIGLVGMLKNMDDLKGIGDSFAIALLTTLWGAVVAYVIAKPWAEKIRGVLKSDVQTNQLILEGALLIKANTNPRLIADIRVGSRQRPGRRWLRMNKARPASDIAWLQDNTIEGEVDLEEASYEPKALALDDEQDCPNLAAPWMATFSDLGTLLMAFFVLILARSVVDSPRMEMVMGSVAKAFGVERKVPKLEIPMAETMLETDYTPAEAERTINSDATQDSKDTTQEFIKQMTERRRSQISKETIFRYLRN